MGAIDLKRAAIAAAVALAGSLLVVPNAWAHIPQWGDPGEENRLEDIDVSVAYYQQLAAGDQVDIFSFTGVAGQHLHVGVNIPAIDGLDDYGISIALLGPGLPSDDFGLLPSSYPEAPGAVVYPTTTGDDFFEPFTQTRYWGRQGIELELPADGTYYVLAWHPQGSPGKYVIDFGREESFGLTELLRLPYWWVRVHLFFRP